MHLKRFTSELFLLSFEIMFSNRSLEVQNTSSYLTACSTVNITTDARFSNKNTQIL